MTRTGGGGWKVWLKIGLVELVAVALLLFGLSKQFTFLEPDPTSTYNATLGQELILYSLAIGAVGPIVVLLLARKK